MTEISCLFQNHNSRSPDMQGDVTSVAKQLTHSDSFSTEAHNLNNFNLKMASSEDRKLNNLQPVIFSSTLLGIVHSCLIYLLPTLMCATTTTTTIFHPFLATTFLTSALAALVMVTT